MPYFFILCFTTLLAESSPYREILASYTLIYGIWRFCEDLISVLAMTLFVRRGLFCRPIWQTMAQL